MKLEKREVTLNEKDTLRDMIFFEENLAEKYRAFALCVETKEEKSILLRHAEELGELIERLQKLLKKPPKM